MKLQDKFFIISSEKWTDYYPLQVVYEWEKVIAETLQISIDYDSQITINKLFDHKLGRLSQKIIRHTFLKELVDSSFNYYKRRSNKKYLISFLLNPIPVVNHYLYQENAVVILLDVFSNSIEMIPQLFKNRLIFVTNIEVLNYFKSHPIAPKLRYIPLSISDIYYNGQIPAKQIDVLQMGRQNIILHNWMLQLTEKHPHIEYVYAKKENGINTYYSTTRGVLSDKTGTRQEFIDFLGSARISLLSAPGIDGGDDLRTGGFNPVTPRFYESAVKYCYMIGRFPDGADFVLNNISKVCRRPADYEEFEQMVLQMLNTPFNLKDDYDKFIKEHLTSTIAKTIEIELTKLN